MRANNFFKNTKYFLPIFLVVFLQFSQVNVANAQASAIKEFFFGKTEVKKEIEETKKVESDEATTTEDVRTNCEIFDAISANAIDLENSSAEMQLKIEKVDETVDEETLKRENIFSNIKELFAAKSRDKLILKEMKKQILDAKDFYKNVDAKVSESYNFINENDCEDALRADTLKLDGTIATLKEEESAYKKQLVSSLKEKVKILQAEVKNIKK